MISQTPTRKGRPLNQKDYELLKTATMWQLMDPNTIEDVQGVMLPHKEAQDAKRLLGIYNDMELKVRFLLIRLCATFQHAQTFVSCYGHEPAGIKQGKQYQIPHAESLHPLLPC